MSLTTTVERIRAARGQELDDWLYRNVTKDFPQIDGEIRGQVQEFIAATQEMSGFKTRGRIARLYNFGAARQAIDVKISNLAVSIYDQLVEDRTKLHERGIRDGISLSVSQMQLSNRRSESVRRQLFDTTSPLIPRELDPLADGQLGLSFATLGPTAADYISGKMEEAAALSQSLDPSNAIWSAVDDGLGSALAWAIGMASMALWVLYLGGIAALLRSHAEMFQGWMWYATLDSRVCISCIVSHGTIFPISEALRDHPHGRCIAVPVLIGNIPSEIIGGAILDQDEVVTVTPIPNEMTLRGDEWFLGLDEKLQIEILGPAAYAAWKDGAIQLSDLSTDAHHRVYGSMRTTASLTSILGDEARRYR